MKIVYNITIGLILTSCIKISMPTRSLKTVKLHTGEVIKCERIIVDHCGVILRQCTNEKEYNCQLNVQVLSEGGDR